MKTKLIVGAVALVVVLALALPTKAETLVSKPGGFEGVPQPPDVTGNPQVVFPGFSQIVGGARFCYDDMGSSIGCDDLDGRTNGYTGTATSGGGAA